MYVSSRNIAELLTFLQNRSWFSSCEIIICVTSVLYTVKLERFESVLFLLHILINLTKSFWIRYWRFLLSQFKRKARKCHNEGWLFSISCLHSIYALPHFLFCLCGCKLCPVGHIYCKRQVLWRERGWTVNKPGTESGFRKKSQTIFLLLFNISWVSCLTLVEFPA